jgi:hypothetical protein
VTTSRLVDFSSIIWEEARAPPSSRSAANRPDVVEHAQRGEREQDGDDHEQDRHRHVGDGGGPLLRGYLMSSPLA